MRKLAEETARSNSRISVARLDLERLRREASAPSSSGTAIAKP